VRVVDDFLEVQLAVMRSISIIQQIAHISLLYIRETIAHQGLDLHIIQLTIQI
jgi:hypothetical protein